MTQAFGRPFRILNQAAIRTAERSLRFCYLCGRPLSSPGVRFGHGLAREHVIPRSLLGPTPACASDRWPIVLWVHAECERAEKRDKDDLIRAIQALHTSGPEKWGRGDVDRLAKLIGLEYLPGATSPMPVIHGVGSAMAGVWTWIRGLHAALYGQFLPRDVWRNVMPPVPGFNRANSNSAADQMAAIDAGSELIVGALYGGAITDTWDGVLAWGQQVRYRCIWHEGPENQWTCLWILIFPGVLEFSASVRLVPVPWRGFYTVATCPPGASMLTGAQLDARNRAVEVARHREAQAAYIARSLPPSVSFVPARRRRPSVSGSAELEG